MLPKITSWSGEYDLQIVECCWRRRSLSHRLWLCKLLGSTRPEEYREGRHSKLRNHLVQTLPAYTRYQAQLPGLYSIYSTANLFSIAATRLPGHVVGSFNIDETYVMHYSSQNWPRNKRLVIGPRFCVFPRGGRQHTPHTLGVPAVSMKTRRSGVCTKVPSKYHNVVLRGFPGVGHARGGWSDACSTSACRAESHSLELDLGLAKQCRHRVTTTMCHVRWTVLSPRPTEFTGTVHHNPFSTEGAEKGKYRIALRSLV